MSRTSAGGGAVASWLALAFIGCSSSSPTPNPDDTSGGAPGISGSGGHGAAAASGGTGGSQAGAGRGGTGGSSTTGGMSSTGGSPTAGGSASGGATAGAGVGGASGRGAGASGGRAGAAGRSAAGTGGSAGGAGGGAGRGAGGTGGGGPNGPCDIYAAASTPCVAAHSMVRALYAAYSGPLYQVRRNSDHTTKDIPVGSGGFADTSVQDTFCMSTTCTISILYDQTANENDLAKSPKVLHIPDGGTEANASKGKITVSGHTVYGIYVTGYSDNVAYRNNSTKGVATGDAAEAMYMIADGKRFSDQCCFDYGNAETDGNDDGNGTMEAVYFGSDITWGGKGDGNGPWVAGDLENGVFKSDKGGWQSQSVMVPSAKSIVAPFAVVMLKGPSGNHFTLKAGNAQSGMLTTMWDSVRPSPGYSPKKLQGAIILGTGGDGSNGGTGTFYEGAMTAGNPPDSVDDQIQANIVAAGFGH